MFDRNKAAGALEPLTADPNRPNSLRKLGVQYNCLVARREGSGGATVGYIERVRSDFAREEKERDHVESIYRERNNHATNQAAS